MPLPQLNSEVTHGNFSLEKFLSGIFKQVTRAVNWVQFGNAATGDNPSIETVGNDTNVGLDVTSKGTGGITLWAGAKTRRLLKLVNVASAVNEVQISPAATGAAPLVEVTGGDTNVSMRLDAKGIGVIGTNQPLVEEMAQVAVTDTVTLTIAQLIQKVIDGTPTAAATYTLPTAALLVAGIANARVGDSFWLCINNKSAGAFTITVAAGAGGTADGTLTVAQNVIRNFLVIVTNVTAASEAYSVYGMG